MTSCRQSPVRPRSTVAVGIAPPQTSFLWTVPTNLVFDPSMKYFFTAKLLLPTPAVVAAIAPLAGLQPPTLPSSTSGGVLAQTAWGYTVSPASATIALTNPQAGASYYLDQWAPITWTTSGLANSQIVYVELYYMQGKGDTDVSCGLL